jgi:hypothetical protein
MLLSLQFASGIVNAMTQGSPQNMFYAGSKPDHSLLKSGEQRRVFQRRVSNARRPKMHDRGKN